MKDGYYEFDPCSIDGSDIEEEEMEEQEENITLDNWVPTFTKKKMSSI